MTKYYTTVGIFKLKKSKKEGVNLRYPVVYLGGEERTLDLQEMLVWTTLNWRILQYDELRSYYEKSQLESENTFSRSFDEVMKRLAVRGLIAEGVGSTEEEALYNLIFPLTVVPLNDHPAFRLFSVFRLWLVYKVPFYKAKVLFGRDRKTKEEKKIMRLAFQAALSTAEMVKCIHKNRLYFSDEDDLIGFLYREPEVTSDNIADSVRGLPQCRSVMTDIINLYLRQQILFERL